MVAGGGERGKDDRKHNTLAPQLADIKEGKLTYKQMASWQKFNGGVLAESIG